MKLLVKLGGTLLETAGLRASLAQQLAELAAAGHQVVVVHGGGKQMTQLLTERGVQSHFVEGLRVTTPPVIEALLQAVGGSVNHYLVAALNAAGARPVGLSGLDANLAEAQPLREDLGAVGRITTLQPDLLNLLSGNGYMPIVACLAGNASGDIFNVNADQMAVACAAAFRADRLLFCTDVPGVRGAEGEILPEMTPAAAMNLISMGVATGGMQAKLNAATLALSQGVGDVVIVPGASPQILSRLMAGEAAGTRFHSGGERS